jgi:geranylgeranyl pyrophosphate synthase
VDLDILDASACAVEMIHAYSLAHDDLPCMDDDDLRRGKPTTHKAFDQATAILAGDALQTQAFLILASQSNSAIEPENRLKMIDLLASACGANGMVGGQAIDIQAVGTELDLPALESMHKKKTGALIRASVLLPAIASEASAAQFSELDQYASAVGLAFQIQDDILDMVGETSVLGKTSGKDQASNKPTYSGLHGLKAAQKKAAGLTQLAHNALSRMDQRADGLRDLASYIIRRNQ